MSSGVVLLYGEGEDDEDEEGDWLPAGEAVWLL